MFRRTEPMSRVLLNLVKPSPRNNANTNNSRSAIRFLTTDTSTPETESSLAARYTAEEKNLILQTVNTCAVEELKKYQITESRIKKLVAYRDKNVRFKTLDQVFLLPGIDVTVLDKFCRSITKVKPKTESISRSNLTSPPLDESTRLAIETCTGIWVRGNIISWAQLDMSSNLLNWNCHRLDDGFAKESIVTMLDTVAKIISNVPPSHVYVMENDAIVPFSRINGADYYAHLQRRQIIAAIICILGTRQQRDDVPESNETEKWIRNVYMLRSGTPARLFDLLIGSEIVSSGRVVKEIIEREYAFENGVTMSVQAPTDIRDRYKSQDIYLREQMNWALLLTAAFVNLSINRTVSLKRSNRRTQ